MQSITNFIEYDGESSESKECEAFVSNSIECTSNNDYTGCFIWFADIKDIKSDTQMQHYISRVTEAEKSKILRNLKIDDQKRALVCTSLRNCYASTNDCLFAVVYIFTTKSNSTSFSCE
jgi:hypothetical protein